jgi:hypothetical protein
VLGAGLRDLAVRVLAVSRSVQPYGVAGAVLLVLSWLYVGSTTLLLGVVLTAVLAGRVEVDPDRPPGEQERPDRDGEDVDDAEAPATERVRRPRLRRAPVVLGEDVHGHASPAVDGDVTVRERERDEGVLGSWRPVGSGFEQPVQRVGVDHVVDRWYVGRVRSARSSDRHDDRLGQCPRPVPLVVYLVRRLTLL